jgi:hypothetical protein
MLMVMNKFSRLLLCTSVALVLFQSCSSYMFTVVDSDDTSALYHRGQAYGVSHTPDVDVISHADFDNGAIRFSLIIGNTSDEVVAVREGQISLYGSEYQSGPWYSIEVFEARSYFEKRRRQIVTGQVLMAVSAALEASTAGYSSGTVSGFSSSGRYYSARYTSYSPALASAEIDRISNTTASYIRGGNAEIQWLEDNLLFPSDILPEHSYSGFVFADDGDVDFLWYRLDLRFRDRPISVFFRKDEL